MFWNTRARADVCHIGIAFVVVAALACTPTFAATVTYLQSSATTNSSSAKSQSLAFTSANSAGSLIVAAASFDSTGGSGWNCSDSQGNPYSKALLHNDTRHSQAIGICYAAAVKAGPNTVTVTYGLSHAWRSLAIHEYSGVAAVSPLDKVAGKSTTAAAVSSPPVVPTENGELIFGVVDVDDGSAPTITAGSAFTGRQSVTEVTSEDQVQATAISIAATFTLNASADYSAIVATFKPDVTPPTVSLTAPAANATVSGVVPVSATASDDVGVVGVQFRLDGALLGAEVLAAPYAIAWNTLGSASGDLVFGVTKVATGPPTMTAGSGFTSRLGVSCPGCTGADMVSEDEVQTSAGPTAATWTFSTATHYQAQMAAFKLAGTPAYVQGATATSNSSGATIAQAFGAPVVTGHLLVVAVVWQGTNVVSVTDSQANVYAVATSAYDAVNGQSLAILYAANVAAGATTVTASFSGTTAPTLQRMEMHEYSGIATTSPLDVTATNSADGTTAANTITSGSATTTGTALVSNGSHVLTAQARDAAGNTTTSAPVTVTVSNGGNTTPPVISAVAASAITLSGATISWTTTTASDSQVNYGLTTAYGSASALNSSLVTSHSVALSGMAASTTYHYRVQSRDAGANLAVSGDFTFTTLGDVTPPTVSISAPTGGATVTGAVPVSATASDNVGVVGVQFRLDGAALGAEVLAAPYTVSWTTTTAANGLHTLTAVARDAAANQTTSAAVSVTVANPPVISAVAASAITLSGATISWTTTTASDSQVNYGLTTAYGSASALNSSLVASHSVALSGMAASTTYHYRVQSRDAGANLAVSGDFTFTTLGDVTPPTVSISAPSGGATVTGAVPVSATASDNVGVVGVQFRLDGAALGAEVLAAPYTVSWTTTTATNGLHTLTAVARDAAANQTTSAAVSVTVANPPVISAVAASAITLSGATISWTTTTASDSQVNYGLTTAYGSTSTLNTSLVTSHSVALSGLAASTTYHYRVQSRDAGANLAVSGDFTFTTLGDVTPPTVSISAPSGGATVTGAVPVSAIASDNVGVVGVQFRLDGVPLGAEVVTAPYAVSWNSTTATNGSHILTAVARDAAGNQTTSAAVSVTVANNTTPPVISAVAASAITIAGATISWTTNTASDSQVDYGLTTAYGSTSALNSSLVTAHTVSLSGLTGTTLYHYRVQSRDAAGNLALSGDVTFTTLDGTPPTVSLTAPAANATVSGVVPVSATASDNVGVAGVQFRLDGALLGAEVLAAPYAIAWNTLGSASGDLVFGVTKVATGPPTMTAGSGFTSRLGVSCPGCTGADMVSEDEVQTSAGPTAATWTFSTAAHYQAQMAAFKLAGTPAYVQGATATSNSSGATIAQAFGAPVVTGHLLVVAVVWQGTNVVSVTDSQANVYAVATSAYDAVNGQSLAILYAANVAAGATTVTASFSGTTAPTLQRMEMHEYSGIATTSPLDVTATNSADGTTAANTITSGSATTTGTALVSNGSHVLTAQARDAAGNTTTSAPVTVTVSNGGNTTPPVISAVAASAITLSGATISWTTTTASDSQVNYGLTTAYGSASALNSSLVASHSVALSGMPASTTYHYRVQSRDAGANLAVSGDFTFTTLGDVTPPTVSISAPTGGATVTGAVPVSATASDNVGVVGVQFRLDGAALGAEVLAAPYTVSWTTTTAANGLHTLTAVARDAAANQTTSAAVSVTVANPPVISAVAAVSITSSGATIDWTTTTASDSQVNYGLTTAYGSTSPLIGTLVTTHAVILGALTGGTTYHVRVRSKDAAGNLALSGDFSFITLPVDVTPPVVAITAPAANATVSGTITFSATATDNTGGSGMAGVEFKLDGVDLAPEDTVAPYTVAWDTTTGTNGTHTLTAVAWDVAGNQATATRTVTVANATAQVQLAWDTDTMTVAGYKVKVGTSSGVYSTANIDVGNVIAFTVTGLAPGNVYYLAVTAYDSSGDESLVSNEVSAAR